MPPNHNVLGISAFYHDSAAAIIVNGEIMAAVQEERFTRKKHDPSFPSNAVEYCLQETGLALDDLDAVVFYDKPLLKFERLLETYYNFAPQGLSSFITAIPVWLKEKLFIKKLLRDELKKIQGYDKKKFKLLFPEHHLSHAASAFYPSPFEEAAILTLDGVGEWATASICHGKGNSITNLKELHFPHSVGLFYSAFTYYLGFKVNSGEYKLMGLAPYGNSSSERVEGFISKIKAHLIDIREDGSVWLNQKYFSYVTGLRMVKDNRIKKLLGIKRRLPEQELLQDHCDLALAVQLITEEIVIKMAKEALKVTGTSNICFAGGVALNCVANGKILEQKELKNIFIQPAAGDAGGAAGAALAAYFLHFEQERKEIIKPDGMKGAFLGPEYSALNTSSLIRRYKAVAEEYIFDELVPLVAEKIKEGNVIGWFQGRMEFGPRALGNRSILADPRNPEMQKKVNLKIKYRENFRPFAPAVLADDVQEFFNLNVPSPYMLLVKEIVNERRKKLPEKFSEMGIREKLHIDRSDIPAVTHVDFSARIQTVHRDTNERFWKLLQSFKMLTGYGMLLNTSFNVRGEPIVCTPEDAYNCFMNTEMDFLVIGNYLFDKNKQPGWKKEGNEI